MPARPQILPLRFFRTPEGREPVREWLRGLDRDDRREIGGDVLAVQKGWLSDRHLVPRLGTKGQKSQARPAFAVAEVQSLLEFMPQWIAQASQPAVAQMRELLRDYVEVLLHTGMRHGTVQQAIPNSARCVLCECSHNAVEYL